MLYPSSSPYFLTNIVNNQFLDIMVDRPLPKRADDIYGNPTLWWVFAQRNPNRLKDPLFDFVTGLGIYLPQQETLTASYGI